MNPSKWNFLLIAMLASFSSGVQPLLKKTTEIAQNDERQRRQVRSQSFDTPPYWEYILREFVFKTISPPPPGNHELYKRLLDGEFYGGPFPIVPNDATSVVLSRGDVYHLADGHWLFCQQGCTKCEVCTEHTHPTVKWALRRIKRVSSHGSARHDLQLTIVPQLDGSYHMRSLWPRSYVYVTSQADQDSYLTEKHGHSNDGDAYANVQEDVATERNGKSVNFWAFVDRNSLPDKRVGGVKSIKEGMSSKKNLKSTEIVESTTIVSKRTEDAKEEGTAKKQTSKAKFVEHSNTNGSSIDVKPKEIGRVKALAPKLILGTDQTGQKHLVHVVPADTALNTSVINSMASSILNSAANNKTAYQRILRRIFESLNSNKKSIENFLEPLKYADRMIKEENEEHQQQETRSGLAELGRANRFHPVYNNGSGNESLLQKQDPDINHWARQRRGSDEETLVDKFINSTIHAIRNLNNSYDMVPEERNAVDNSTFHRHVEHKNEPGIVNSKLVKNNYVNSTFGNSIRNDNHTLNNQDYKFIHRKYKIMVSTESSTESVDNGNRNENVRNFTFGNENNTADDRNILQTGGRNKTK